LSISQFGRTGPWVNRPATEFTLQALCGSTSGRGRPDGPPIHAGGRVGEWATGACAAVAALAALRLVRRSGRGELVDVSMLECMSICMNSATSVFWSFLGKPPVAGPVRSIELPSIEPTKDGYVGLYTLSGQQFRDFLVLIDRPDLVDDQELARIDTRMRRMDEFLEIVRRWTTRHTTEEVIELASQLRIPVAPIGNGETVVTFDHFRERGAFVRNPRGAFLQPRAPYRIHGCDPRPFAPAPRLGEHTGRVAWSPRSSSKPSSACGAEPLCGIRIVDFTAFWAGPSATHVLAALGADVIKVESIQRPDGMRFNSARPPTSDSWWEWSALFHATNTGKRSITLDMNRPEGIALARELIRKSDAVFENFTPRVMEHFGLTWEEVSSSNPRILMVRMPAFGLTGPWRDRPGFAPTMEQVSGMAWITGFPEGPPLILRGPCDPIVGMHAAFAFLVALAERERSGKGRLIEVAMVEAALNVAAEQVVEFSAYGRLLERRGNRGPAAAPQGVYRCRGEERWLALAVASDAEWRALRDVMGDPEWARSAKLASAAGRRRAHDQLDEALSRWLRERDVESVLKELLQREIPAAAVVAHLHLQQNAQLAARGFFEELTHPLVGTHRFPSMPFRFASRESPWLKSPAPTLGQHNEEILGGLLGRGREELERLRAERVIGARPLGT